MRPMPWSIDQPIDTFDFRCSNVEIVWFELRTCNSCSYTNHLLLLWLLWFVAFRVYQIRRNGNVEWKVCCHIMLHCSWFMRFEFEISVYCSYYQMIDSTSFLLQIFYFSNVQRSTTATKQMGKWQKTKTKKTNEKPQKCKNALHTLLAEQSIWRT